MDDVAFHPSAPLPPAPDPWEGSSIPPVRAGPPYRMTEMIAAEPALARRLLARLAGPGPAFRLGATIREAALASEPVIVTGCGTSEHGAMATAAILRDVLRQTVLPSVGLLVQSRQAFEAALDPQPTGVCLGISHEGGTWATNLAMEAARGAGATVGLVSASDRSPGAALAEIVVTTEEMDQSWCHTIGYVSPILAAAAIAAHVAETPTETEPIAELLADGIDEAGATKLAEGLAWPSRLTVVASGADIPAAYELALKIEEGAWIPTTARELETFLHGHLAATDETAGLVLILTDRDRRAERLARARAVLSAVRAIGMRAGAILAEGVSDEVEPSLLPAGRLIVPEAPALPAPVASLIGTVTPLQLLAERLARVRGTNPDPIRRDDPRYLEAAEAAG
jgi:fructoselysine-6-P-deglycase FrlB-like protein